MLCLAARRIRSLIKSRENLRVYRTVCQLDMPKLGNAVLISRVDVQLIPNSSPIDSALRKGGGRQ